MKRALIIAGLFGNNRQGYDLAEALRGNGCYVRLVQYSTASDPTVGNYGVNYIKPKGVFSKVHVLMNMFSMFWRSCFFRCDYVVVIGVSLLPVAALLKWINNADLVYYALEYCSYGAIGRSILRKVVNRYIDVEENRQIRLYNDIHLQMPYMIMYNMPSLIDAKYDKGGMRRYLQARFGLSTQKKIVLYAGSYQSYCCLDQIVLASRSLAEEVIIVFMIARGVPKTFDAESSRCYFVPPQSGDDFFNWVAEADGMLLPYESDDDFNVKNCSPQKLFDCYKLGVPYLASDRPLIRKIHATYQGAGCFCDFTNPESIANGISVLVGMKNPASMEKMTSLYRERFNYTCHAKALCKFVAGDKL